MDIKSLLVKNIRIDGVSEQELYALLKKATVLTPITPCRVLNLQKFSVCRPKNSGTPRRGDVQRRYRLACCCGQRIS